MRDAQTTRLRLAVRAAGFPPATRRHVLKRVEEALLVYREAPADPPSGKGRPRDRKFELLLIELAVQFHVEFPTTPGVTKRGERYSGALVEFCRRVLDVADVKAKTRDLGRLIYSVVRKEAQIHGDLDHYPPLTKRSRSDWRLPTDVPIPDDPFELHQLYVSRLRRRS